MRWPFVSRAAYDSACRRADAAVLDLQTTDDQIERLLTRLDNQAATISRLRADLIAEQNAHAETRGKAMQLKHGHEVEL